MMKNKFEIVKKWHGYNIISIKNQVVHFTTHILVGKIMQKFRENEVPTTMVSLATQCSTRFQFNQVSYLCKYFLKFCREVQEEGKTYHYTCLIIIIMLISWKDMEESKFPPIKLYVCEATEYASLQYTKEFLCAMENRIFFIILLMDLHMVVNQHIRLSPSLYRQYCHITNFKVNFH